MNIRIPADFLRLLDETGWVRSQMDPAFWRHQALPGRRFDTSCAVIEALTMRSKVVIKNG